MDTHASAASLATAVRTFADTLEASGANPEHVRLAREAQDALSKLSELTRRRSPVTWKPNLPKPKFVKPQQVKAPNYKPVWLR